MPYFTIRINKETVLRTITERELFFILYSLVILFIISQNNFIKTNLHGLKNKIEIIIAEKRNAITFNPVKIKLFIPSMQLDSSSKADVIS